MWITLRKVCECPFALVNFMMNFYNVGFSVCHSFRSLSQCGRVKDFKGCFQVFDRCSPRQQNSHAAVLFTMSKGKNFSFVSSIWGKEKALKANIEPLLVKIEPLLGKIEPLVGKIEPLVGIIEPARLEITQNVYRRARNLTDVKGKTPLTDETSAKAVVYMNRKSYVSSSINAIKRNLSDFSKTTDVDMLCSRGTDEIDTHFKIADQKQKKRRRNREPSRVSMKRIVQFMKKRKTRYKLKVIIRKYIPKSSRLYSFATDYKLCYIRYLKRCDSFFTSFVNLSKPIVNKLLKKSSSHSRRFSVSRMKLMTSGDIELNPGPQLHVNVNTETTVSVGSTILLNFRLRQLGLRPLDVGGAGDYFFRAVSHQFYGDPCHHLQQ